MKLKAYIKMSNVKKGHEHNQIIFASETYINRKATVLVSIIRVVIIYRIK